MPLFSLFFHTTTRRERRAGGGAEQREERERVRKKETERRDRESVYVCESVCVREGLQLNVKWLVSPAERKCVCSHIFFFRAHTFSLTHFLGPTHIFSVVVQSSRGEMYAADGAGQKAHTGHSIWHNAQGSASFWMCKVR